MANSVTFIKRSSLPVVAKGKLATDPKITISDKGQMTLNPVAVKFLGGNGKVALLWDATAKLMYFYKPDAKAVSKLDPNDFIEFKAPKVGAGKKAKSNILSMSFGTALQRAFNDHVYDYKGSGSQSFPLTLNEEKGFMSFALPNGALPKRPVIKRTPRKKADTTTPPPAAAAAPATTGQTVNGSDKTPPPAPAASEELVLD